MENYMQELDNREERKRERAREYARRYKEKKLNNLVDYYKVSHIEYLRVCHLIHRNKVMQYQALNKIRELRLKGENEVTIPILNTKGELRGTFTKVGESITGGRTLLFGTDGRFLAEVGPNILKGDFLYSDYKYYIKEAQITRLLTTSKELILGDWVYREGDEHPELMRVQLGMSNCIFEGICENTIFSNGEGLLKALVVSSSNSKNFGITLKDCLNKSSRKHEGKEFLFSYYRYLSCLFKDEILEALDLQLKSILPDVISLDFNDLVSVPNALDITVEEVLTNFLILKELKQ